LRGSLPPAVVLAAGVGRRLAPLTDDRPKARVEVGTRTLLERALLALGAAGFARALVVTGHRAGQVDEFLAARDWPLSVTTRFNELYASTNNIVTLLVAEDWLRDGFCLLNSDIVFDPSLVQEVAAADASRLVVDTDEPLGDEEMKVVVDHSGRVVALNKQLPPADAAGEYIGIARLDGPATAVVLAAARRLVDSGHTDLYYEHALEAAAPEIDLRLIATDRRPWTEIDDHIDLARAQQVAAVLDARASGSA
jgi:L-glutamine-phosphate cytidylyltransferase